MNQEEKEKITFDSTKIEQNIIAALFVAPKKIHAASEVICSSDFSTEQCKIIFSIMQNLSNRNLAIDVQTVNAELSKSPELTITADEFKEMLLEIESANLLTYCNELKEISERRKAAGALKRAEAALKKGGNLHDIFSELEAVRPTDPGEYRNYQDNNLIKPLISVLDPKEKPEIIPTGFENLDKAINGGLSQGVYLFSAVPGLGKTSFVSQILDSIALNGRSCLMFNYEMDTGLLLARSLARLAYRQNYRLQPGEIPNANEIYYKTLLFEPDKESPAEKRLREKKLEILSETQERYEAAARNLYYVNCDGAYTADRIERRIARHITETNQNPVVAVDYLQIMPAMNPRQINQTEIVSTNLSELTRISRKFNIPVIVISATNRKSYNDGKGSLSAFKSSGTAEYTSSLGMVMFYTALKSKNKEPESLTEAEMEYVTIKAVKGRNVGNVGEFEFERKGAWTYFEEVHRNNAQPH